MYRTNFVARKKMLIKIILVYIMNIIKNEWLLHYWFPKYYFKLYFIGHERKSFFSIREELQPSVDFIILCFEELLVSLESVRIKTYCVLSIYFSKRTHFFPRRFLAKYVIIFFQSRNRNGLGGPECSSRTLCSVRRPPRESRIKRVFYLVIQINKIYLYQI